MVFEKDSSTGIPPKAEAHAHIPETAETQSLPMQTVFLGCLLFIALLAAASIGAEIILPTLLAFILKLVLQPVMRVLTRWHVPRALAALLIILLLFGSLFALGSGLAAPAASWTKELSNRIPTLQHRLSFVTDPILVLQNILHRADSLAATAGPPPVSVAVEGSRLSDRLITDSRSFILGIGQTVLVFFFLLIAGDTFLRRLVEILPRFSDKRHAVEISQHIESDISAYLATISIMNLVVGFATGIIMTVCGIKDPVLWGTMAFLLNYIPILGPITGITMFAMVGLTSFRELLPALMPAGLYLTVHLTESLYVTPHFLARRFTLNPVMIILGLIFWYWMWGVPGAILSTPMLAIAKIICDHVPSLKPVGHFFEGEIRDEVSSVTSSAL